MSKCCGFRSLTVGLAGFAQGVRWDGAKFLFSAWFEAGPSLNCGTCSHLQACSTLYLDWYLDVHLHVFIHIRMYVHVNTYIHMYMSISTSACIDVYTHVYIYICIYIYVVETKDPFGALWSPILT